VSQLLFDNVKKASPFGGSKPVDFRNRILTEADREYRDYNYSLTFRFGIVGG
jgi:hypothetical protein